MIDPITPASREDVERLLEHVDKMETLLHAERDAVVAAESRASIAEAALRECVGVLADLRDAVHSGGFPHAAVRRADAAISTPPAAVALAEREVIEAACALSFPHVTNAHSLRAAVERLRAALKDSTNG